MQNTRSVQKAGKSRFLIIESLLSLFILFLVFLIALEADISAFCLIAVLVLEVLVKGLYVYGMHKVGVVEFLTLLYSVLCD